MDTDLLLTEKLKALHSKSCSAYNELSDIYPHLSKSDPRLVTASHITSVISSTRLMKICFDNLFLQEQPPAWFENQGFGEKEKELEDYIMLNGWSCIVFPFSLFEAGIRRIVRALDQKVCNNGNTSFSSIYTWLFKYLVDLSFSPGEPKTFLDLYSCLRNTIHNNGAFFPKSGKDKPIKWREKDYNFIYGEKMDFYFLDWTLLAGDLIELNLTIMRHEKIINLPKII